MGLKSKYAKLTQKWVLFKGQTWPYEIWILKDQLGLICEGRKEPVEREGREEEEEEEEEDKKKEGSSKERYGNSPRS